MTYPDWAKQGEPHYVYIAYRRSEVLYVGCTWNPAQRLSNHRGSPWIALADAVDIFGPFPKDEALEHERAAIWILQPSFNKRGKDRSHVADEWADAIWTAMGEDIDAARESA